MDEAERAVIVWTAVGSEQEARRLAMSLVESRLAACVQRFPIASVYTWNQNLEQADEVLLLIKTTEGRYAAVEAFLLENHSYEVPEILMVPAQTGSPAYLAWLVDSTQARDR